MNKKLRSMLLIWIPIILIAPFLFILIVAAIINRCIPNGYSENAILLFDLSKGMSVGEYLVIYATFSGICVTFFLGVVIYQLNINKEENDIKKQQECDKLFLLKEITTYIDKIYERLYSNFKSNIHIQQSSFDKSLFEVDEKWKDKLFAIRECIAEKQYNTLYQFFIETGGLFRDKNMYDFIKKFTIPFYAYQVSKEELKQVDSLHDVLSFDLYLAINALIGTAPSSGRKVTYKTGQLFFEENAKGTKYTIYDLNGEKVQDYDIEKQIGFKTIRNSEGIIRSQGFCEKNKIIDGIVNNAICDESGKYEGMVNHIISEELTEEEYNEKIKKDTYTYIRYANFKVINGEYHINSSIKYGKQNLF